MLTTFRCERPTTRPYKWCYQPQHFTWNKKCQINGHGWNLFVIFDLCKFATTQAIIIPYFVNISLTYKAMTLYLISKTNCSFKKPNCYGFIHRGIQPTINVGLSVSRVSGVRSTWDRWSWKALRRIPQRVIYLIRLELSWKQMSQKLTIEFK